MPLEYATAAEFVSVSEYFDRLHFSAEGLLMKAGHRLAIVCGLMLSVAESTASDWSRFRGPDGNSVVEGGTLPHEWAENLNVAWKVKIPGRGWSQPVVAGDRIFVTTAIAENEEPPRRFDGGLPRDARDARLDVYH